MANRIHANSIETYKAIADDLAPARRKVFMVVTELWPVTRQALSVSSGIPINAVTGRVRELIDLGHLVEQGTVLSDTGKPRALLVPTTDSLTYEEGDDA